MTQQVKIQLRSKRVCNTTPALKKALHIYTKLRFDCHAAVVDWGLGRKGRKWYITEIFTAYWQNSTISEAKSEIHCEMCAVSAVWYCVRMFLLVFFRGVTEEGRYTQDGHHSRVLRGKKCSYHRGHRLYGESTSGEAATLLSRCQSCLCACPAQSRTGAWSPYCWHDQLQGEQVQVWRTAGKLLNWVIYLML